jgi:HK97 family phage portal protein
MTGIDAQTLDQRRYQVEEICRFFGVNPIMVAAESKNTTYASAEQMFLAHVVHTLAPWYSLLEQSMDANLLTERQRRDGYYSNHVEEGLLRGSPEQTMMVLTKYVELGIITPDEARSKLDMNPLGNQDSGKLQDRSNAK